jgi:hypothetical protein
MLSDTIVVAGGTVCCLIATLGLLKMWAHELVYYRRIAWNFTVDSKYSGTAKWGGDFPPNNEGTPMSNRFRVTIYTPFLLSGFAIGSICGPLYLLGIFK